MAVKNRRGVELAAPLIPEITGPSGAARPPRTRSGEGGGCGDDGRYLPDSEHPPQLQRPRLESDGYPERPVDPCILADSTRGHACVQ